MVDKEVGLLLLVTLPVIVGVLVYFLKGVKGKYITFLTAIFLLGITLWLLENNTTELSYSLKWSPLLQINLSLGIDGLSIVMILITLFIFSVASLFIWKYMENKENLNSFYSFLLLFLAGILGVALARDLILFYLFWELMLLSSYFLLVFWGEEEKKEKIALKYFIYTHIGSILILVAFLWLISWSGTSQMKEIAIYTHYYGSSLVPVILLLLFGFGIKLAIFPFHSWLPEAYASAPTPVAALFASIMMNAGIYGLIRFLIANFTRAMLEQFTFALMIMAVITQFYGGFMALVEKDLKRMLGYSSISQMGYVLLGVASISFLGVGGAAFQIVNHALVKCLLFLIIGSIIYTTGVRNLEQLGGLAKLLPYSAFCFSIGALALAGAPPLSGFIGEFMIFGGALSTSYVVLAIISIVSATLTAGYALWWTRSIYFGPLKEVRVENTPSIFWSVIGVLSLTCILIGVFPEVVFSFLRNFLNHIGLTL